jgi:hypothetical protein
LGIATGERRDVGATSGGADVAIAGHLKGKHRGVITRTAEAVFEALIYLVEKYGKVFPSLKGSPISPGAVSSQW